MEKSSDIIEVASGDTRCYLEEDSGDIKEYNLEPMQYFPDDWSIGKYKELLDALVCLDCSYSSELLNPYLRVDDSPKYRKVNNYLSRTFADKSMRIESDMKDIIPDIICFYVSIIIGARGYFSFFLRVVSRAITEGTEDREYKIQYYLSRLLITYEDTTLGALLRRKVFYKGLFYNSFVDVIYDEVMALAKKNNHRDMIYIEYGSRCDVMTIV